MRTEMTRYSKNPDKQHRKNTLVTMQQDDVIYFGIARCNHHACDEFRKDRGKVIAKARAIRATLEQQLDNNDDKSIMLHETGLRGHTDKKNVRNLLDYFDNIDTFMKKRW